MTPQDFIAAWIRAFAPEMVRGLDQAILKRKLTDTDALRRSLYAKVTAVPEQGVYFMVLFFETYGRYQDMNRDYRGHAGGEDMVEELFQWAQRHGIEKFTRGKFAQLYEGVPLSRILNAIAWGTIRKYNLQKPKKRPWYNRTKAKLIAQGYNQLLQGYAAHVLDDFSKNFNT